MPPKNPEGLSPSWVLRRLPQPSRLLPLMQSLGVPAETAAILYSRGFTSVAELDPPLTPPPLPGVAEAAQRILRAIDKGERIRVHGDYDADGVTAAALLTRGLAELGASVHAFIPHRLNDGYGLSMERVGEHVEAAELLVTVDCGITGHRELSAISEAGVAVIVTDHHSPGSEPPPGIVVHPAYSPRLQGVPWPTGSGVAFFLLWEVRRQLGLEAPLSFADLAAIGTVADVVPLLGVNRALVKEGLARLRSSHHVGLRLLAERHCSKCTAMELAFRIAPRINAAGRLGEADTAFEALTTEDEARARQLIERLEELNSQRQRIEEEMLSRVQEDIEDSGAALVVHDPAGHPGVMGIVASRIVERYLKPVFIIAQGKGSVRSTPGVSAVKALAAAEEHLLGYGGHAGAAGFSIEEEKIPEFRRAINEYVAAQDVPQPQLLLDGGLAGDAMAEVYRSLLLLEPFGHGNPSPVFFFGGAPSNVKSLSGGKHVAFSLGAVRVIKWKDDGSRLKTDAEMQLAASLVENEWQGVRSLELRAVSYRYGGLLECEAEGWRVLPLQPRLALNKAREQGLKAFAVDEGEAFLRERGIELARPEDADVWFAIPEKPSIKDGVILAVSEVTFSKLLQPPTLRKLKKALAAGPPFPDRLVELIAIEAKGKTFAEMRSSSQALRKWCLARQALERLRLSYRYASERCLGLAIEQWWRSLALLDKTE